MTLIDVGDIQLDYERSGSGPPLLLIMGMSGTALHWGEPFLTELRKDFDVIAYDHRGIGQSTRLEEPEEGRLTILQMAQDASGLLDALGIDSAHVVGISMGGMIAQELALARPELVKTLTLGCTYCGGPGSALTSNEIGRKLFEGMQSGDRLRAIRTGWEVNVSPAVASDDALYATFLGIAERRAVAIPVAMAQALAIAKHDTSARLGELQMPVLVIHGSADEMLPVANGQLIASLIPGSHLEILDGVGHLFFWELPERSAELIRDHAAVRA